MTKLMIQYLILAYAVFACTAKKPPAKNAYVNDLQGSSINEGRAKRDILVNNQLKSEYGVVENGDIEVFPAYEGRAKRDIEFDQQSFQKYLWNAPAKNVYAVADDDLQEPSIYEGRRKRGLSLDKKLWSQYDTIKNSNIDRIPSYEGRAKRDVAFDQQSYQKSFWNAPSKNVYAVSDDDDLQGSYIYEGRQKRGVTLNKKLWSQYDTIKNSKIDRIPSYGGRAKRDVAFDQQSYQKSLWNSPSNNLYVVADDDLQGSSIYEGRQKRAATLDNKLAIKNSNVDRIPSYEGRAKRDVALEQQSYQQYLKNVPVTKVDDSAAPLKPPISEGRAKRRITNDNQLWSNYDPSNNRDIERIPSYEGRAKRDIALHQELKNNLRQFNNEGREKRSIAFGKQIETQYGAVENHDVSGSPTTETE